MCRAAKYSRNVRCWNRNCNVRASASSSFSPSLREVDPAVITTTIVTTIVGGVAGGSVSVLQAAAMMMSMCAENKSSSSSMVVWARVPAAGEAGGWLFMILVGTVLITCHWGATSLVWAFLRCRGRGITDHETGELPPPDAPPPDGWACWEAACLRTRYPHWACMALRVLFPGIVLESMRLFRADGTPRGLHIGLASVGALVGLVWVASTWWVSYVALGRAAGAVRYQSEPPDETQPRPLEGQAYAAAIAAGCDPPHTSSDGDSKRDPSKVYVATIDAGEMEDGAPPAVTPPCAEEPANAAPAPEPRDLSMELPPMFVWFTEPGGLQKMPWFLRRWFIPLGWWTPRRAFNRRYATFYNTYVPLATRWAPALLRAYVFLVAVMSVSNTCEIPLTVLGIVNAVMVVLYVVCRPCRRPFENLIMLAQLSLSGMLAFSRGQNFVDNAKFFCGLVFVTLINLGHVGLIQGVEVLWMYDPELARYLPKKEML